MRQCASLGPANHMCTSLLQAVIVPAETKFNCRWTGEQQHKRAGGSGVLDGAAASKSKQAPDLGHAVEQTVSALVPSVLLADLTFMTNT